MFMAVLPITAVGAVAWAVPATVSASSAGKVLPFIAASAASDDAAFIAAAPSNAVVPLPGPLLVVTSGVAASDATVDADAN